MVRDQSYRPEIDGLRAVAVALVILFHARVPGMSGGYIGVDIFFVISGYLITRNILALADRGEFSFADFYVRRARRLGPALLATVLLTLIGGSVILTPNIFAALGKSAVFAALSASNFLFWAEAGYFDVGAELKPLLHTWSLGVEEQFYLVWPAILLVLSRNARSRLFILIALAGIVSLLAAEFRFGLHSGEVFYLLPYRVSEFAIGALCIPALSAAGRLPRLASDVAGVLSLGAIAAAGLFLDDSSRVPGVDAIVPCFAAAVVIAGLSGRIAASILSSSPVVWVGRVSYSLYLVHWPITVYYFYLLDRPAGIADQIVIIVATLLAGALMHYFVEARFRYAMKRADALTRSGFALAIGASMGLAVIAGAVVWSAGGWPGRLKGGVGEIAASLELMKSHMFDRSTALMDEPFVDDDRPNVVIIGDSHGANLLNAFVLGGAKAEFRHIHIQYNCQLYFGARPYGADQPLKTGAQAERCERQADSVRDNELLQRADYIIASSTWRADGLQHFGDFLRYLQTAYSAQIIIMAPRYYFDEPEKFLADFDGYRQADKAFDNVKHSSTMELQSQRLGAIATDAGVAYIDLTPFICDVDGGTVFCPLFSPKNEILYFDWHHWSPAGEAQVGQRLRQNGLFPGLF